MGVAAFAAARFPLVVVLLVIFVIFVVMVAVITVAAVIVVVIVCFGLPVTAMVVVVVMAVGAFDRRGEHDAQQQGRRELAPVVGVELHFREQIAQGNADEEPARKGQRGPDDRVRIGRGAGRDAEGKQQRPQRAHQGEGEVHQAATPFGPAASPHQGRNRQGVERFVQQHRQKDAKGQ